ncbi:MAG: methyltransferase domain-containing protein [Proteobacteria bacterium]|nr:methyltransferase domain-containing protein [Pseudomonadota bacterium]
MDWARHWEDRTHGGHASQDEEFLAREAREKLLYLGSGDRLLDFGCGSGDLLVHYAPHFRACVGADFSPTMLDSARKRLSGVANVTLVQADAKSEWHKVPGRFDCITTAGVDQYLSRAEISTFLEAARDHLNPGGRIVIFDTIHPQRHALREVGLGFERAPLWRVAYLAARTRAAMAWHVLNGKAARTIGEPHSPALYRAIAARFGLTVEFVMSAFYDYRYHVILRPAQSGLAGESTA